MQTLIPKRRHRAMARNKRYVIAQRQEFAFNRIDQLAMVATREIATPHPTFEYDIARNQQSGSGIEEDHVPWSMTGTVQHL